VIGLQGAVGDDQYKSITKPRLKGMILAPHFSEATPDSFLVFHISNIN